MDFNRTYFWNGLKKHIKRIHRCFKTKPALYKLQKQWMTFNFGDWSLIFHNYNILILFRSQDVRCIHKSISIKDIKRFSCRNKYSIRTGNVFTKSKLFMAQILALIYCWYLLLFISLVISVIIFWGKIFWSGLITMHWNGCSL